MKAKHAQMILLAAILLVALLLGYAYYSARRRVLDPSNDAQLSKLFDQANPTVAGTAGSAA
jgi:cell division protein FtsL